MRRRVLEVVREGEMKQQDGESKEFYYNRLRAKLHNWSGMGGRPEVLRLLREGVPVLFEHGAPPPRRAKAYPVTQEQQAWFWGPGGPTGEPGGEYKRLAERGVFRRLGAEEAAASKWISPAFCVDKAPKPDGTKVFRTIIDLRYINKYSKKYKMRMEGLPMLGKLAREGDWMIGFDISDAFYHIPVRREDRKYFRFTFGGEVLECLALPMGWTNSCYFLTKVLRTVAGALRGGGDLADLRRGAAGQDLAGGRNTANQGGGGGAEKKAKGAGQGGRRRRARCLAYLDDFLLLFGTRAEAVQGAADAKRVLADLGLSWAEEKCNWEPVQAMEHLGMEIDTKRGLYLVTERRQKKIESMAKDLLCRAARGNRRVPTRLAAQFNGLVQSVDLAVPTARFFLRELYTCVATGVELGGWNGTSRLTRQAIRDLEWLRNFSTASKYNGRAIWRSTTTATLSTDACVDGEGRGGWGAVLHGEPPQAARGFWGPGQGKWHITRLELLGVKLGIETFLSDLRGRRVRLLGDNQAVNRFMETFTSRSPELMRDIRELYWLLDSNGIELLPEWISSEEMEVDGADGLSRLEDTGDWALDPEVWAEIKRRWEPVLGKVTWDRFATAVNKKCENFNARWACPGCPPERVDALSQSDQHWRGEVNLINPPWALMGAAVAKLLSSGAKGIVVAPFSPTASWWPDLMAMTDTYDVLDPSPALFRPGKLGGDQAVGPPRFKTVICRVPGQ